MTKLQSHLATQLRSAVQTEPGVLPPAVRVAIYNRATRSRPDDAPAGAELEALVPLADKVALHAYKVMDEDFAALQAQGFSEETIYEVVASAAVGAGMIRLEHGLRAIEEARR